MASEAIVLKNENYNLSALLTSSVHNNCKVIFNNGTLNTNSLILGALDPLLRKLLADLPPYIDQCLLFPEFNDLQHFIDFTKSPKIVEPDEAKSLSPIKHEALEETLDDDYQDEELDYENFIKADGQLYPIVCKVEDRSDEVADDPEIKPDPIKREGKTKKMKKKKKNPDKNNRQGIGLQVDQMSCDVCHKVFSNILILELHIRKYHDPNASINPYFEFIDNDQCRCRVCGFVNNNRRAMKVHYNYNHAKKKRWPCDNCDKVFRAERLLHLHQRCHTKEKEYFCPLCGEGFIYQNGLRRHHLLNHATEEERVATRSKYQCDLCGYNNEFLSRLKRHMETHNTEQNYACDECGKTFNGKRYLQQHYRKAHVLGPQKSKPKTDEQKIAAAARARVYRARKAGKIPGFPAKNQDVD